MVTVKDVKSLTYDCSESWALRKVISTASCSILIINDNIILGWQVWSSGLSITAPLKKSSVACSQYNSYHYQRETGQLFPPTISVSEHYLKRLLTQMHLNNTAC